MTDESDDSPEPNAAANPPTNPKKKDLMPSSPLRRTLRGLGHALEPIVQIGHHGVTEGVVKQLTGALFDHELVKVKLGSECPQSRFEVAERLSDEPGVQVVQILGRTVLVYKRHPQRPRYEGAAARSRSAARAEGQSGQAGKAGKPSKAKKAPRPGAGRRKPARPRAVPSLRSTSAPRAAGPTSEPGRRAPGLPARGAGARSAPPPAGSAFRSAGAPGRGGPKRPSTGPKRPSTGPKRSAGPTGRSGRGGAGRGRPRG